MVDLSRQPTTVKLHDASKVYHKICDIPNDLTCYDLQISASGIWYDWTTACGVDGYSGNTFQPSSFLRVKTHNTPNNGNTQARYFTLIGVIAPSDLETTRYQKDIDRLCFVISTGTTVNIQEQINKYLNSLNKKWWRWGNTNNVKQTQNYSLYVFANDVKYFYFNNNVKPANIDITISTNDPV